jgi:hypothetical protein
LEDDDLEDGDGDNSEDANGAGGSDDGAGLSEGAKDAIYGVVGVAGFMLLTGAAYKYHQKRGVQRHLDEQPESRTRGASSPHGEGRMYARQSSNPMAQVTI